MTLNVVLVASQTAVVYPPLVFDHLAMGTPKERAAVVTELNRWYDETAIETMLVNIRHEDRQDKSTSLFDHAVLRFYNAFAKIHFKSKKPRRDDRLTLKDLEGLDVPAYINHMHRLSDPSDPVTCFFGMSWMKDETIDTLRKRMLDPPPHQFELGDMHALLDHYRMQQLLNHGYNCKQFMTIDSHTPESDCKPFTHIMTSLDQVGRWKIITRLLYSTIETIYMDYTKCEHVLFAEQFAALLYEMKSNGIITDTTTIYAPNDSKEVFVKALRRKIPSMDIVLIKEEDNPLFIAANQIEVKPVLAPRTNGREPNGTLIGLSGEQPFLKCKLVCIDTQCDTM